MGGNNSTQISTVSASEGNESNEAKSPVKQEKELTFEDILNNLNTEKHLVDTLMHNLTAYCKLVQTKVLSDPNLAKTDRTKLYFYQRKSASHAEEISERLAFLNYYASVSNFVIAKE